MAFVLIHGAQVLSDLLTFREKGILVSLQPPQCKLIKTTVAQVLEAKEMEGGRLGWSSVGCGVVGLVEDESVHSHFLRLYCVKSAKLLWEQELYIPFQYNATCNFFHTFPADGYQVGLNFANEMEAEEFYLEVKDVQRKQEQMTAMMEKATTDQEDEGKKESEQHSDTDAPSTTDSPTTTLDLDPVMKGLLMQARLTEDDLKDIDIAEAVDCIISSFGGLHAVQKELRKRDSISQASSSTEEVISPALEGPVQSPPTAAPEPAAAESNRENASLKHEGSSAPADRHELILNALKDVFRQKQLQQEKKSEDGSQMEPEE